jgi:uncharacterized phage protein (TIGR02220 family)
MQSMYAKLYSRIAQSSLMEQAVEVRYCFMMLLAIADTNGDVIGTDVAIARTLNIPLETFKACINSLMQPDPDSNSQTHEGRRVVLSDSGRGYHLVNYTTYRAIKTEEEKRAYMRDYMRERRKSLKEQVVTDVNTCKGKLAKVTQLESESESESDPNNGSVLKKKSSVSEKTYSPHSRVALFYLNEKTGRMFQERDSNLRLIDARLKEPGVTIEGVKQMIDRQVARWKGTDQEEYLRPETLFNATKFDSYYAARELPAKSDSQSRRQGDDRNAFILTPPDSGGPTTEQIAAHRLAKFNAARNGVPPAPDALAAQVAADGGMAPGCPADG